MLVCRVLGQGLSLPCSHFKSLITLLFVTLTTTVPTREVYLVSLVSISQSASYRPVVGFPSGVEVWIRSDVVKPPLALDSVRIRFSSPRILIVTLQAPPFLSLSARRTHLMRTRPILGHTPTHAHTTYSLTHSLSLSPPLPLTCSMSSGCWLRGPAFLRPLRLEFLWFKVFLPKPGSSLPKKVPLEARSCRPRQLTPCSRCRRSRLRGMSLSCSLRR